MTQKEVREQLEKCEQRYRMTIDYPALLKQLDEAMRFLKEGHDRFHGHLGDHDNCLVRDAVRAYFGETR